VTTQFKRTTGRACSRGAVLILIAASFGWTAAAQPKFQKLTGAQIHATFGGMELSDEVHWYDLFEKNGTLQSSSMGHKRTGKWWTERDQLCIDDSESTSATRCEYQERMCSYAQNTSIQWMPSFDRL
jgi:hypothetical protein